MTTDLIIYLAVIWVKKRQKAAFLGLISSKSHQGKEKKKEPGCRKKEEKGKKTMVALLVFIMPTLAEKYTFGLKRSILW